MLEVHRADPELRVVVPAALPVRRLVDRLREQWPREAFRRAPANADQGSVDLARGRRIRGSGKYPSQREADAAGPGDETRRICTDTGPAASAS
eukprot:5299610-Pyramimonas_sp.AAC.1